MPSDSLDKTKERSAADNGLTRDLSDSTAVRRKLPVSKPPPIGIGKPKTGTPTNDGGVGGIKTGTSTSGGGIVGLNSFNTTILP